MRHILKALLVILTVGWYPFVAALQAELTGRTPLCMEVEVRTDADFKVRYSVSGKSPHHLIFRIQTLSGQEIYRHEQSPEHKYHFRPTSADNIIVCFQSSDGKKKTLTFTWRLQAEERLVGLTDLEQGINDAVTANRRMQRIFTLLSRDYQKMITNKQILKDTDSKVKWGSIIKLSVIVLMAVAQIVIISRPFRNSHNAFVKI